MWPLKGTNNGSLQNDAIAADARPKDMGRKRGLVIIILFVVLIVIFLWSFTVGRYAVPLPELLTVFFRKIFGLPVTWSDTLETVLFNIRIPRIMVVYLIS